MSELKYTSPMKRRQLTINSSDFWVKATGVLGQINALIDEQDDGKFKVLFINETSWVFDEIEFGSEADAIEGLTRNKFVRYDKDIHEFIYLPKPPFSQAEYMNQATFSSGEHWS